MKHIKNSISSSFMVDVGDISPAMASSWLSHNRNNRRLNKKIVKKYERIIRNGQWRTTHQGIAFFTNGNIADGQHRLTAIVNTGITVRMMVVVGIALEDAFAIDNVNPRSAHDRLTISHLAEIRKSSLPVIYEYIAKSNLTDGDTKLIGDYFKEDLEFLYNNFRLNSVKNITNSVVSAVIALAHHSLKTDSDKIRSDKLIQFCKILRSGEQERFNNNAYSVIKLHNYLINLSRTKKDSENIKTMTKQSIYQYINGCVARDDAELYLYPKDAPLSDNANSSIKI